MGIIGWWVFDNVLQIRCPPNGLTRQNTSAQCKRSSQFTATGVIVVKVGKTASEPKQNQQGQSKQKEK